MGVIVCPSCYLFIHMYVTNVVVKADMLAVTTSVTVGSHRVSAWAISSLFYIANLGWQRHIRATPAAKPRSEVYIISCYSDKCWCMTY